MSCLFDTHRRHATNYVETEEERMRVGEREGRGKCTQYVKQTIEVKN